MRRGRRRGRGSGALGGGGGDVCCLGYLGGVVGLTGPPPQARWGHLEKGGTHAFRAEVLKKKNVGTPN